MNALRLALPGALAVLLVAAPLRAQEEAPPAAPTPPHVPIKFSNLRFDEDWSALGEPGATTDHPFPGMKWMELSDDWAVSFGGQIRVRTMHERNKSFNGPGPEVNDFVLTRVRVHADLRHKDGWRVFAEGLDARIYGEDRPPIGIDRNPFDLHNAFVEYGEGGVTGRVGRMELQYGGQELVSPLDWGNTRRRFQGGLVRFADDGRRTDVFLTRPVDVDPHETDDPDGSERFAGIHHRFDVGERDVVDVFWYELRDSQNVYTNEAGAAGDMRVQTLGGALDGDAGDTDYKLWAAMQSGDFAGDTIDAYAWTAEAGHTFRDTPGTPRVALGVDYASGDSSPGDGTHETFNQLYPLAHAYLGLLDVVARSNIIDVRPSVSVKVPGGATLTVAYHDFTLAESEDAVYNAAGAPGLADPTGAASRDLGEELDVTLAMKPKLLGPTTNLLLGYSRFDSGKHYEDLGRGGDAELVYVQLVSTF